MSDNQYVEWLRGAQAAYEQYMGDYVMSFDLALKVYAEHTYVTAGTAELILTDERWIENKGGLSLIEHLHRDYNDKLNWNEPTIYEYLEGTLLHTNYGMEGGTNGKLARILKIQINEEFRGNGYFSFFLKSILDILKKMDVDFMALYPQPFGENTYPDGLSDVQKEAFLQKGTERLRNFYARFGFEVCGNDGYEYMTFDVKKQKEKAFS